MSELARLVRLHKYIADAGVVSRRKAEEYILRGKVTVNGIVVDRLGVKIDPQKDVVMVEDKLVNRERSVCPVP
ncbi:MAG: hypothetical protein HQK53_19985 [Oligoflexia bacterium]|nr:hypothetical protein [Oligoflexia bacterium]